MTPNILIVEDEPAIRQMLGFTLAGDGYRCLEAGDVDEAHGALNDHRPDLILLDWMLPGISGVDFARGLKRNPRTSDIPIIMLTAKGEEADKVRGLDSGVDDFITKPFSPRELLARIRAVMRRSRQNAHPDRANAGGICIDQQMHTVTVRNEVVELSPTEFRLLQFFLARPERVYSRDQLLDGVWGSRSCIEERTVDVHILRLRKILAPFGIDHYVQTVRGVGYRFSVQER